MADPQAPKDEFEEAEVEDLEAQEGDSDAVAGGRLINRPPEKLS